MEARTDGDGVARKTRKAKTTSRERKRYSPPRLEVYGDLRRLTMVKGGTAGDAAKPATRLSGPPG